MPMTTHRSLNKMERKAHMNIHDVKDVADDEAEKPAKANYTRDRFGKKHAVDKAE